MKPLVVVGAVLIVLGGIVVALQGVSYVRDRQEVSLGPIEISAEERGFISRSASSSSRPAWAWC